MRLFHEIKLTMLKILFTETEEHKQKVYSQARLIGQHIVVKQLIDLIENSIHSLKYSLTY